MIRATYPKFLSHNPKFLGFTLIELSLVAIGLFLSLLFQFNGILGLVISLILIAAKRLIQMYVDYKAIPYMSYKREFDFLKSYYLFIKEEL